MKKTALALAASLAFLTNAQAQATNDDPSGKFSLGVGFEFVMPNGKQAVKTSAKNADGKTFTGDAKVKNFSTPIITADYRFSKEMSAAVVFALPKKVKLTADKDFTVTPDQPGSPSINAIDGIKAKEELLQFKVNSVKLIGRYHVSPDTAGDPYIGAGIDYMSFSDVTALKKDGKEGGDVLIDVDKIKSKVSLVLNAGARYDLGNNVFVGGDVYYTMAGKLKVRKGDTDMGEFKANNFAAAVSVGYTF